MYAYVKKWNFSNASIVNAGNIYKKTELATRRIVLSVANALGVKDTLEGEALVNFVENIEPYAVKKSVETSSDSVIGDNDTSEVSEDGNV